MIPDLLAGTIQLSFENITTAYPQVKGGRLKALAVTSAKRSFVAPTCRPWPKRDSRATTSARGRRCSRRPARPRRSSRACTGRRAKILRSPENQKKLAELGLDAGGMAPEELTALIRAEIPKLGKVVRDSGAKVD